MTVLPKALEKQICCPFYETGAEHTFHHRWSVEYMWYKPFGRTRKKLSVFGFGGSRFRNEKSVDENAELVAYAYEKGVNHFDSCPGYTASEEVFSQALRGCPRDTYIMSTKNQPFFTDSGEQAKDSIKRSLEKMGMDHFDFYYLWNVKKWMNIIKPSGCRVTTRPYWRQGVRASYHI